MIKVAIISALCFSYMGYAATNLQPQDDPLKASIKRGEEVYKEFCITCHMSNGKGIEGAFPPLDSADFLLKNREASIRAVKFGLSGELTVNGKEYNNTMTNLGLYDEEVADVMNYVLNSWSNKSKKMVTEEEVKNIKKAE
ncbi:hypothetical protein GCM10007049_04180 [Echinicola pacifica]|uniref:Cytochrome c domain-containing protein n=1 Tax=Echinicola pacifica TaxID=346377 RepID=A0A918UIX2_9BACT|nr:cytochrome c [Echinicola pacifica]GGZ15274.1 hypothetical protein GCM10007049_04180 [Echinicola pacifica]